MPDLDFPKVLGKVDLLHGQFAPRSVWLVVLRRVPDSVLIAQIPRDPSADFRDFIDVLGEESLAPTEFRNFRQAFPRLFLRRATKEAAGAPVILFKDSHGIDDDIF